MSNYPFDPKELEIKRRAMSFDPTKPGTALFDFPVSEREALLSLYNKGEAVWMPYGVETGLFCPSVIPDNIARGFVFEAERWPVPYTTHDDMFGVNWTFVPTVGGSMETPGIPHPFEDANDWKESLKIPDPYDWDWDASARMNNDYLKNNGKANMFWFLNGATFERLISFMGFENAAMALLDEDQEDALHELLEALMDLHLKIIDCSEEAYGDGINGYYYHDDWGSQKSPFFSCSAGAEFFVPVWKRFTSYVKGKGKIAELHSCGHCDAQIENIIEAGWQTWTPMAMNDTHGLYEKYGDKIVIAVVADPVPADATDEEKYEAGKAFAEKFCKPGKIASFSLYSPPVMCDPYARGLYETSRKILS
ncbi:MAG: methyltransferase [Oscillospiraceae bacterium]|nr:methyltransferase [Oscillospiraceae bacterium]